MLVRKPRNLSKTQIAVALVIGVLGGVYIWRPAFEKYQDNNNKALPDIPSKSA